MAGVDDWQHTWEVVRLATALQDQAVPPHGAMVYYLGDSIARESTVSDAAWTDMLGSARPKRAGKVPAFGYTVAGHNQTFGMDETIVEGLPPTQAGQPAGILLIGVGISRFIGPPTPLPPFALDPPPSGQLPGLSPWDQHHYDGRAPLSVRAQARARAALDGPSLGRLHSSNKAANLAAIRRIIVAAQAKGLRPVLLDLPLNVAVVGRGLDKPRAAIRAGCAELAQDARRPLRALHRFHRPAQRVLLGPAPPARARLQALAGATLRRAREGSSRRSPPRPRACRVPRPPL